MHYNKGTTANAKQAVNHDILMMMKQVKTALQ